MSGGAAMPATGVRKAVRKGVRKGVRQGARKGVCKGVHKSVYIDNGPRTGRVTIAQMGSKK